ncbi:MAG: hypothetical protein F4Z82_20450 [Caldilineaceae bacterium SB0668_bin_21]|nr:hypothetical protein [Caldilineaceae bacterium SB0668_bin_21]MYC22857.1 hypothetical protein [Caldilineaceae bacterium SB0662_bin_25]
MRRPFMAFANDSGYCSSAKADLIVRSLFSSFIDESALLPPQTLAVITETGRDLHRVVCDHIAGMTDRYAIAEYRRLFDPEEVV